MADETQEEQRCASSAALCAASARLPKGMVKVDQFKSLAEGEQFFAAQLEAMTNLQSATPTPPAQPKGIAEVHRFKSLAEGEEFYAAQLQATKLPNAAPTPPAQPTPRRLSAPGEPPTPYETAIVLDAACWGLGKMHDLDSMGVPFVEDLARFDLADRHRVRLLTEVHNDDAVAMELMTLWVKRAQAFLRRRRADQGQAYPILDLALAGSGGSLAVGCDGGSLAVGCDGDSADVDDFQCEPVRVVLSEEQKWGKRFKRLVSAKGNMKDAFKKGCVAKRKAAGAAAMYVVAESDTLGTAKMCVDAAKSTGQWTAEEHELFVECLAIYGRNYRHMTNFITTRTRVQIANYAKKFFEKVQSGKAAAVVVAEPPATKLVERYRSFKSSWLEVLPTLYCEKVADVASCPERPNCPGCSQCAVMYCSACKEAQTPGKGTRKKNAFAIGGVRNFRLYCVKTHASNYHGRVV